MKKSLTAACVTLAATLFVPSPARAADLPITDIGIAPGTAVNAPVTLRPTVTPGADIASIKLEADSGSFVDLSQGDYAAPWELQWNPMYFLDQDVTLTLIAVDSAGNGTRSEPVTVYVDKTGPLSRIDNPTEPGWGLYVSVRRPITFSATDRSGLNRLELLQDGKLLKSVSMGNKTSGKASAMLDPATKNGEVKLTTRAVDRFGNSYSTDFRPTVDNNRPTGAFLPSGTYLRGKVTTWPDWTWENVFIMSMSSYLDDHKGGTTSYTTRGGQLSASVDSKAVKDGRHTLSFELTDLAGNVGVTKRTVYVDNTLPALSLTSAPKNNAKLTKKVTLKAEASDKYGVAKVQLLVNGKVAGTDTKAGYQFTLNPKKYGKTFTIQLRAYDKAGNVRYSAKRTYRR